MFIASNHNGGIMELFEDGRTRELSPPGLLVPSGVAILNSPEGDQLIVADHWNVKFFDTKSFRQARVIPSGFYPWVKLPKETEAFMEEYRYMLDVGLPFTAVSDDGKTLVISSWQSDAVNIYDLEEMRVKRTIDGNRPIYAMMFGDSLVVSELETHSVVSISPDGKRQTLAAGLDFLRGSGTEDSNSWMPDWLKRVILKVAAEFSDGLVYPSGLAAEEKNLWVADWFKGEIFQVVADGKVLEKPKVVAKGLEQPEGIAVARDGALLAIESEIGCLVKIDPANGKKTVLAENLKTGDKPGFKAAPSYLFSGVAVGSDGAVYVSCDKGLEVVRVKE